MHHATTSGATAARGLAHHRLQSKYSLLCQTHSRSAQIAWLREQSPNSSQQVYIHASPTKTYCRVANSSSCSWQRCCSPTSLVHVSCQAHGSMAFKHMALMCHVSAAMVFPCFSPTCSASRASAAAVSAALRRRSSWASWSCSSVRCCTKRALRSS